MEETYRRGLLKVNHLKYARAKEMKNIISNLDRKEKRKRDDLSGFSLCNERLIKPEVLIVRRDIRFSFSVFIQVFNKLKETQIVQKYEHTRSANTCIYTCTKSIKLKVY